MGTPGYYWQAAGETFKTGDYLKTLDHLDRILATNNEYTARALPWALVLTSGMASGYMELADNYETGGRVNKSDPLVFRRAVSNFRGSAGRLSLQFADNAAKFDRIFDKAKDEPVPVAFGYPAGSAAPVGSLGRVSSGIVLPPSEVELAQKRAIERGVLLAACRAVGAPDDTAKAQAILKAPDAKVPRAVFAMAVAQTLYTESQLYAPRKLDDPQKLAIFCQRAGDTLKNVPASKESKDLAGKIQSVLKKSKKG